MNAVCHRDYTSNASVRIMSQSVPTACQQRANGVPTVCQSVPTNEERLIEIIKDRPSISRTELSKLLNISVRQVRKIIDQLREKGILTREGGKSGRWVFSVDFGNGSEI